MEAVEVAGTEGYAEDAETQVKLYESISFADLHLWVLHLIPTVPGWVVDIGAGSRRDAGCIAGDGAQRGG